MSIVYHGYDREALDRQYDNSRAFPDYERFFALYRELSERTRRELTCTLDIPYGPTEMERLDIFPSGQQDAATWIFIHGGYWRRLDKTDFSYIADPITDAGVNYISLNYALAPAVTVREIVRQVRGAAQWVFEHVRDWDGDPERIFIGGHSVGGQLAVLVAASHPVAGVTSISGLADLEPVALSYVNEWARLTPEDVADLSPIHHLPANPLPLIAYAGSKETDEFRRQTAILAQAWEQRGYPVHEGYLEGEDHFSIAIDLHERHTELMKLILSQCSGRRENASRSARV